MTADPLPGRQETDAVERTSLDGVVALVTGASRGLGRALCLAYARHGARVALCARGRSDLERTATEVRRLSGDVLAAPIDVTDERSVAKLVQRIEARWGAVGVLVNNASSLGERAPLRDYPLTLWRRVLDVNLTGALIVTRAVLPGMRRAGAGSIINVSSGVGDRARALWGAYAVSKWGLEGFSYNLALEEEEAGVCVNIVDPGRMRTSMRRAAYPDEDPDTLPDPDDRTDVFVWLARAAEHGVTGRRFSADGWSPPE